MESASPNVVIVGRPNVGKSSLLNRLAHRRVSIVDPTAGVTRDRISTEIGLPAESQGSQLNINVVDTGGYGVEDIQGLTKDITGQITQGINQASLILFVVDAQTGLLPLDHQVAQMLRSSGCDAPVLVIANKVDGPSHEHASHEATRLGFGRPVPFSAANGYNQSGLLRQITRRTREVVKGHPPGTKSHDTDLRSSKDEILLAIAGKRNAGKSTLVNALAGGPRVIVSEVAGTTRDSIDVRFQMGGRAFTAIDTAGVRKRKSVSGDIEYYSLHRTLRSVRRAHVVLFLVDATVPISQVDHQLANEIVQHHKPCVIVLNKWDLAEKEYTQEKYQRYLDDALKGLSHAPIAFISAKHGQGMKQLVHTALDLHRQAGANVPTGVLNRVIEQALSQNTPRIKNGRQPKVYYATQLSSHPPTIGLFVNEPDLFDPGYERFLVNRLRDTLPFPEVPIRLLLRGKNESQDWTAIGTSARAGA